MAKSLLIVESPAKAKTIQKYVGNDYEVMASKGHIKDLPKRGGVDVEHGFQESYELLQEKGKGEVIKTLRQKAKSADEVLLATDPDREGEAIAWHLMEEVQKANKSVDVRRVLFNEITKKGVQEGLQQPRELNPNLYEAQRTRRVLDRIGGYPLSNLLWRKLAFGLSAGRVQTPALRLIVDRQREIDAFVPTHYWLVDAVLQGDKPPKFTAALVEVGGKKLEKVASRPAATSEIDAARYATELKNASYRVAQITRREQRRKAPPPYTTSKLQQDASNRLGIAPKRAMSVAQRLYEGVALGRGKNAETVGLITYMRTDSMRLSPDSVDACRDFIADRYGKTHLPDKPVFYKGKKQNVQDAHEAIRPTRMDLPPDEVKKYLKEDQYKLYKLIWDRFVACQMVPAVYDQTSVDIEATAERQKYGLRASGSVLKFPGWKAVYGAKVQPLAGEEEPAEEDDEDRTLPELTEGEALSLIDPPGVQAHHKQTEPPPYFNEASLVKKLEEEGIGRPSTYAEILSKVQARDYVKKENNKLIPSDLGRLVVDRLVRDGFDLADIGFTRKLEEDLDAVAEARAKRLDVLAPFHERLQRQIAKSLEQKGKWWPEPESLGEQCPECGKDLVKRWGRNGPFIGCTGYPECSYTRNVAGPDGEEGESRQPEPTDYKCDKCGSMMLKRWGRNGWFLGCSAFPKCKNTMPVPLGFKCPKCKTGEIIEVRARGKSRRPFYGCTNYQSEQKCDFRLFQKPVAEPCPSCGAPFLVRGGSKDAPTMKCHREACDYEIPLEDFEQQQADKADDDTLQPTGTNAES
ncbi:MAG: type I DNA topoisomerase [Myxococcota bacterium]